MNVFCISKKPRFSGHGILAVASAFLTLKTSAADLTDWLAKCAPNVHPVTMNALVRHESGGNPYAILDNGDWSLPKNKRIQRSFRPQNQVEAVQMAKSLIAAGHVVDMGLGQINNRNLRNLGLTVEQIFDPCTNLYASQTILSENYSTAAKRFGPGDQALYAALSAYNTGSFTSGFTNGYVQKVLQASLLKAPKIHVPPASTDGTGKKTSRPRVTSRKSQLLEAKLATIEVETF
jgi:type IV secretion system protein VirB1